MNSKNIVDIVDIFNVIVAMNGKLKEQHWDA